MVVKAQVKTGGRGGAGGVKLAAGPAGAVLTIRQILATDIEGHAVGAVMLAQPVHIEAEFCVDYVLDRAAGRFLAIASAEGGMESEEVAATRPEAVARIPVDPAEGVTEAVATRIAAAAGLPPGAVPVLRAPWQALIREDALPVEVDPLVRTSGGLLPALDGKVTLDDNARFRQARWGGAEPDPHGDPLEAAAAAKGLGYVKPDGTVDVIGKWRRPRHVHPRRGRGLRRPPHRLPRHRGRGVGRGDGGCALRHPLRPGRQVRPGQCPRWHRRLRRRRRGDRPGPGLRNADQTAGRTPGREQRGPWQGDPRRPRASAPRTGNGLVGRLAALSRRQARSLSRRPGTRLWASPWQPDGRRLPATTARQAVRASLAAHASGATPPCSVSDRDELFGGFGHSWRGAFVGGEPFVRTVANGPPDERPRATSLTTA